MKRIVSFVCVLVFSLFLSLSYCLADGIGSELNNDFSKELKPNNIKNKNNDKTDIPKASNQDIFGDEQAFPFIAGLGKNAAH
tara:strand:+ start:163 stop:408 length:246 start_codon:yes stop_codon:yes gene_type:complete